MKRDEVDIGDADRGGVYRELVDAHLFITGEGESEVGVRGSSLSPFGLAGTAGFSIFFLSVGIGCTSTVGFVTGTTTGATVAIGEDMVGR